MADDKPQTMQRNSGVEEVSFVALIAVAARDGAVKCPLGFFKVQCRNLWETGF